VLRLQWWDDTAGSAGPRPQQVSHRSVTVEFRIINGPHVESPKGGPNTVRTDQIDVEFGPRTTEKSRRIGTASCHREGWAAICTQAQCAVRRSAVGLMCGWYPVSTFQRLRTRLQTTPSSRWAHAPALGDEHGQGVGFATRRVAPTPPPSAMRGATARLGQSAALGSSCKTAGLGHTLKGAPRHSTATSADRCSFCSWPHHAVHPFDSTFPTAADGGIRCLFSMP